MPRRRLVLALICLLSLAAGAWAAGQMMSVQVRQAQLREKPHFLAKVKATLNYGDQVSTSSSEGPWVAATDSGGHEGWLHNSALSEKRIVLQSGQKQAQVKASDEELTLAGKGFNAEVESKYRSKNPKLNYAWVDKAEKDFQCTGEELVAFVQAGGLKPMEKVKYEIAKPESSPGVGGKNEPGR